MIVLNVDSENEKEAVEKAADSIQQGRVVAAPTDTVYGFLADATNPKAIARIFAVKGREKGKALPVFVKSLSEAKLYAVIGKDQEKVLKRSWPGKFTAVLKSKNKLQHVEQGETVALRIPNHALVLKIMRKAGIPLTGTSANVSGKPSALSGEEVRKQFSRRKNKPDLILDAGTLPYSAPSTIMDLTSKKHRIIRRGA